MKNKIYSLDEVRKATLEYFEGDELCANIWIEKYCLKDNDDNLLEKSPDDMFKRIAKEFARIEKSKFKKPLTEEEIFSYFDHFKYLVPAGSPLFGIGNDFQYVSLSNCYLAEPPLDSYASILKTDAQLVNISKRRGGVGIDISNLRPSGAATHNAAKTSTGVTSFMERYSNSIREVGQNNRRGALIITINVHHPEIENFITIKNDKTKVTGANISIKLTNEFLEAVKHNKQYELRFPVDSDKPQISKMVKARDIWDKIIENAWSHGEPGLLFWDNITTQTPADCYEEFASKGCNPCSELNLSVLDSCRLMSLVLYRFVKNPFTDKAYFDYDMFSKHAQTALRLMDDLVDLESEKIEKIIKKVENDPEPIEVKQQEIDMWKTIKKNNDEGRRTGLGLMGLADTIAGLNIKYGSDESLKIADEITKTLKLAAYRSSVEMAKELGSFKIYDYNKEKNNPYIMRIKDEDPELYKDMKKYGRRNISLLTVAPTGSISILAKVSSGIEPLFEIGYTRRRKLTDNVKDCTVDFIDQNGDKWQNYQVFHKPVTDWMEATGEKNVKKSPWFGACANDIEWERRIKIQGRIQKNICHSISSTINLPKNVEVNIVKNIYENSWKLGLKGITVYREGSRTGVLVNEEKPPESDTKNRPKELPCEIYYTNITKKLDKVRHFQYMVLIGIYNNKPYELFAIENGNTNKKIINGNIVRHSKGNYDLVMEDGQEVKHITKETTENEDSLTRMVSLALRHSVPIHFIVEQLNKVEGEMFCFAKAISRSLKKFIKEGTISNENCEKCQNKLVFENGCFICKQCGASKCN